MIKTHGLSHVALCVVDPDRALNFYRSVFGVREYFRDESTIQVLGPTTSSLLRNALPTLVHPAASSTSAFV